MFPVGYELGFYIPEEGILHSHRRENLKSYIVFGTGWPLLPRTQYHYRTWNGG
jgi:hypothetical protein